MNYARVAAAAAAAWIVDGLYGFVVYGQLLNAEFAKYPGVFRPLEAMNAKMPFLFAGLLLTMLVASYIYAKGYEGGSGVAEGARFGAALGVFVGGYSTLINWAVLRIGRSLALSMVVAAFVEWLLVGLVIGLVYKPAASASRTVR